MKAPRLIFLSLFGIMACQSLVSCATEPKKRERVPPSMTDNSKPWNLPQKWEGSSRYGSMMPQSH